MRDALRRIFALIKKEFITTWMDKKSRGMIIALPLLQLFIFSNAIASYEKISHPYLTWLDLNDIQAICQYILKNAKNLQGEL